MRCKSDMHYRNKKRYCTGNPRPEGPRDPKNSLVTDLKKRFRTSHFKFERGGIGEC